MQDMTFCRRLCFYCSCIGIEGYCYRYDLLEGSEGVGRKCWSGRTLAVCWRDYHVRSQVAMNPRPISYVVLQ